MSAEIIDEIIERLEGLFPEAVTDGRVDPDVLLQLLGSAVEDREEKYGLTWHGKRRARQLALTPSTGTLRPEIGDSVEWDSTRNLMIEGDNLEVLKLLQKSYAGKVNLIYIDPPYNTGHDFVYQDDYRNSIHHYLRLTGQVDSGGTRLSTNTETSGRFHTDWLNMMYPRLKLARSLLREDGVIIISIDDGEVHHLRQVCAEIFGEDNFVTTVIWQKKYSPSNDAKWLSDNHDYLVLVAKNKESWRPALLPRTDEANARYSNPDQDPRGPWKSSGLDVKTYSPSTDYEITTPSGRVVRPPAGACWRVSRTRFQELVEDGRIWFGKEGNNVPAIKRFLTEVKDGITPLTVWTYSEVGHTQEGTQEVRALGVVGFDSPKPVRLLKRAIQIGAKPDALVMDFFAGSGTTAHAVMEMNAADGGSRRFILVQLPEPLDPERADQRNAAEYCDSIAKPRNLAELTKQRLRLAGQKVAADVPDASLDLGFRTYRLDSSNIASWNPDPDVLEQTLEDAVEHLKTDRSDSDIIHEILLKTGHDLCTSVAERSIAGKTVYSVDNGNLLICLAATIAPEDAEDLAVGIALWVSELSASGDARVIFRDAAFADDVAKTNVTSLLEQHGVVDVRSI